MALTDKIKEKAYSLGFSLAGITAPNPPPHWPVFQNWLALGRNGCMSYLNDPRRADPHLLMSDCRSILVLAMHYPDPVPQARMRAQGQIAAYALGDDYHLVLPQKLKTLVRFIESECGRPVPHRSYTDTGPLLERDLAQQAGLGWIGRNTCLIHPKFGSTFFLAELLLGIELEPDEPFPADRCGKCRRCIEACPTQCILPDRTLDARRCISYLSIENKDEIPSDLREKMGNWIFGCDLCQQVCPWNQHTKPASDPSFEPRSGIPPSEPSKELFLTRQEFNMKFKNSPIQRAKRSGYLRNVSIALGNAQDQMDIPALEHAIRDEDPLISQHARWALERIRKN